MFQTALSEGMSSALTASGNMAAAQKMGVRVTVTAGMGGGDIEEEKLCRH